MKFPFVNIDHFYVDQYWNIHAYQFQKLIADIFVPIVAKALSRACFPDPVDDWVLWYKEWKERMTIPLIPLQGKIPKREYIEIEDWGLIIPFLGLGFSRRQATRWAKRTLAVLWRNRARVAHSQLIKIHLPMEIADVIMKYL